MLRVALTGGIGSGKSLVGEYLEHLGAIVFDSDQLARDVVDRKSTRLNSSHIPLSRMPSSA